MQVASVIIINRCQSEIDVTFDIASGISRCGAGKQCTINAHTEQASIMPVQAHTGGCAFMLTQKHVHVRTYKDTSTHAPCIHARMHT